MSLKSGQEVIHIDVARQPHHLLDRDPLRIFDLNAVLHAQRKLLFNLEEVILPYRQLVDRYVRPSRQVNPRLFQRLSHCTIDIGLCSSARELLVTLWERPLASFGAFHYQNRIGWCDADSPIDLVIYRRVASE